MGIFSEELKILDRNTVKYMVNQMQETIDEQKVQIAKKDQQLQKLSADIAILKEQLKLLQEKDL